MSPPSERDASRVFTLGAVVAFVGCAVALLLERGALPAWLDVVPPGCAGFAVVTAVTGSVIEDRIRARGALTLALAIAAATLAPLLASIAMVAKLLVLVAVLAMIAAILGAF